MCMVFSQAWKSYIFIINLPLIWNLPVPWSIGGADRGIVESTAKRVTRFLLKYIITWVSTFLWIGEKALSDVNLGASPITKLL